MALQIAFVEVDVGHIRIWELDRSEEKPLKADSVEDLCWHRAFVLRMVNMVEVEVVGAQCTHCSGFEETCW